MNKVSIILPSLRPKLAMQSLLAIERCSRGADYEVIMVSPFEPPGSHVTWIREAEARGNAAAHYQGYQAATGDYIVHLSDDVLPVPGWLDELTHRIDKRERVHFPFVLGLQVARFQFSTVYGRYFANFLALSRRSAEAIGGTFSTDYVAHFADADISMRAWHTGGRCESSGRPLLYYVPLERFFAISRHKQSSLERDCKTFVTKWGPSYGSGWGSRPQDVNIDHPVARFVDNSFIDPRPPPAALARPPRPSASVLSGFAGRIVPLASPSQLYLLSRLLGSLRYGVRP